VTKQIDWRARDRRPVHLFPFNKDVARVNRERFDERPEPVTYEYAAVDEVVKRRYDAASQRWVWDTTAEVSVVQARASLGLLIEMRSTELLRCKDGAQYILTRNISVEQGRVNGSRVLYRYDGTDHFLEFEDASRLNLNNPAVQPQVQGFLLYKLPGFALRRRQHPLKLGYAQSLHSGQGMTLKEVMVDLGSGVRQHGQAYVGASRVSTVEGLYLSAFDPAAIRADPFVRRWYEGMNQPPSVKRKREEEEKKE